MCTNRALVDSLECYMDDLVDCFEDFVKKSIIAISVIVGLLAAMIAYVLKTIADRNQAIASTGAIMGSRRSSHNDHRNRKVLESNFLFCHRTDDKGTCTVAAPCAKTQIKDEKVLKESGFSGCSRLKCTSSLSSQRISIPSLKTVCKKCSTPKLSKKSITKSKSCCSLCCIDNCNSAQKI